jgi:hypothetical protein
VTPEPPPYRPVEQWIGYAERPQDPPATWADDDAGELAARRKAVALAAQPSVARHPAARAVGVNEPAVPGTRLFTVETVGPGWWLWSRTPYLDLPAARGGMCVEVLHDTVTDSQTGEIVPRTRYRCLDAGPGGTREFLLDTAEIDCTALAGIDRKGASGTIYWLIRPLVIGRTRRPQLNAAEIQAVIDAGRLAKAITL